MLDIGVYALSIVRGFMDKKPEEVVSQRKVSPTGSDEQATILLKNDFRPDGNSCAFHAFQAAKAGNDKL